MLTVVILLETFQKKKLDKETIDDVISSVIHTPSACNRQMCKIYFISSENMKEKVKNYAMGLGNFELKKYKLLFNHIRYEFYVF